MKQYPSRVKYKKYHKVNFSYSWLLERRSFFLNYGMSGIQACESGVLTYKQIEACRRTLRRGLKKKGKIWIRVFPTFPITKKSIASRMGKGKGNVSHWIAPIRKGQVLFEILEWDVKKCNIILGKAMDRLPINTRLIFCKY